MPSRNEQLIPGRSNRNVANPTVPFTLPWGMLASTAPTVAATVALPCGSICRTLASTWAHEPIPRLADRWTVAPILMGRIVFWVKVGAVNAGKAADAVFTTEIDSATGDA